MHASKWLFPQRLISPRRRFGLFSLPIGNALGDDSQVKKAKCMKGANGAVPIKPRNFQAGRRGNKYFSELGYITIGDEYLELDKIERFGKMLKTLSIPHQQIFKSTTAKKLKNDWRYMEDPLKPTKNHKGSSGEVEIGKRGFLVTQGWGTSKYRYMNDPYDRADRLARV